MLTKMVRCPQCGHMQEQERESSIEQEALTMLSFLLDGVPEDCWRLFTSMWRVKGPPHTEHLASTFALETSKLRYRFQQARLPKPQRYMVWSACARAARFLETPGRTLRGASIHAGWPTHDIMCRDIKREARTTPGQFFNGRTGTDVLTHMRTELFVPYLPTLMSFSPLHPSGWRASSAGRVQ